MLKPDKIANVLFVADTDDALLLTRELQSYGLEVASRTVVTEDDLRAALGQAPMDIALVDYAIPGLPFARVIQLIQEAHPDLPVVVVTGAVGEEKAVDAMHLGARDLILKKRMERLGPAVERELRGVRMKRERRALAPEVDRTRALESRLRAALEAYSAGFALFDAEGRLQYANDGYRTMTPGIADLVMPGALVDDLIEHSVRRGLIAEAIGREEEWLKERDKLSDEDFGSLELYRLDSQRWLLLQSGTVMDGAKFQVLSDITRQKETELSREQSERRIHDFSAQPASWFWEVDAEDRYILLSAGFTESTGYPTQHILGRTRDDVNDELQIDRYDLDSPPPLGIAPERWHETELAFHDVNDDLIRVVASSIAIVDGNGEITGYRGTSRDVTQLRQVEDEAAILQAQLRHAQRAEAVGQVSGGIAHDFNNLLASILGYCELALHHGETPLDGKLRRHLEQILRAGERGRDLVAKLLTYSRGVGADAEIQQVGPILHQAAELAQAALPSSIEFDVIVDDHLPEVLLDPVLLEQVVMNLCINSRDAMHEVGEIRIHTHLETWTGLPCASCAALVNGQYLALTVSDTGPGLPSDNVKEQLFEPFFTTKELGKGTGMGLAVVHGIAHELGGHIYLDSSANGLSISLLLPPAVADRHKPAPQVDNAPVRVARDLGGKNVLVVDDEMAVAMMICEFLESVGFETHQVNDPQAAIDLLRNSPSAFDAIISDLTMPGLSGVELAQQVKLFAPHLPFLLCTGYGQQFDEKTAADFGVDTILTKPLDFDELSRALNHSLE